MFLISDMWELSIS